MRKVRILDLFCGAGGASTGYYRAFTEKGYSVEIVGVDIKPQKQYPFLFIQGDAVTFPVHGFDIIHASPPCQSYSVCRSIHKNTITDYESQYPMLIPDIREKLQTSNALWVIENVAGAKKEMTDAMMLCGTMFNLNVQRHRLFSSNYLLYSAGECHHKPDNITVLRNKFEYVGINTGVVHRSYSGSIHYRKKKSSIADAKEAMGINWMTGHTLGEAIPPAYTKWIGLQLATIIETR